jgi:putative ATP-binding cassette transporter
VNAANQHVWTKFVRIAQPYFYPLVRGGGWITLLLMVLLVMCVLALLGPVVTAVALMGHHLNPTLTDTIAPGLSGMLQCLLRLPMGLLMLASLVRLAAESGLRHHGVPLSASRPPLSGAVSPVCQRQDSM